MSSVSEVTLDATVDGALEVAFESGLVVRGAVAVGGSAIDGTGLESLDEELVLVVLLVDVILNVRWLCKSGCD